MGQIKMSGVDLTLNTQLCMIFVVLLVLCVISAIGAGVWHNHYHNTAWYVDLGKGSKHLDTNWYGTNDAAAVGLLAVFTFVLLYANLVPISLYVTVNMVKTLTASLIDCDAHMFDDEKLMYAKCRNNKIIEEVGQVAYVLSDKT